MKTFYLYIKNGIRIYFNSVVFFDIRCQTDFVAVFDLHELFSRLLIIYIGFQLSDLAKISDPAVSDLIRDPVCKQLISVKQKSSLRDSIRLVIKFLRHHLIEVF